MFSIIILLIQLLTHCSSGKSFVEQQGIKEYELVHFDVEELESSGVIQFTFAGQEYKVLLEANENISPIITGNAQSDEHPKMDQICHYHGEVLNYDHPSMVSVSLCDKQGVRGSIRAFGQEIWIYPSKYALSEHNNGTFHAVSDEHIIYSQAGVELHPAAADMSEMRRRLAYNNGDNVIEVYLLADKTLVDYWKNKEGSNWYSSMYSFLGDMMNTADGYYRGTNWGSNIGTISIKWVALDIVESWTGIFSEISGWQSSTYTGYLNKFQPWYARNKDVTDFDYAMIYASNSRFANEGNIGYSWYDSVCNEQYKCGMMSNTWEFLFNVRDQAELFSHELGHNLGARHDDDTRYCSSVDSTNNIMKSNIGVNGFSPCSISKIQQVFGEQDGYPCLVRRSNPFENNHDGTGSTPTTTTTTRRPTPQPTRGTTPTTTTSGSGSGSYIDITVAHSQDRFMSFWLKNLNGVSIRTVKIKPSNSNSWMSHDQSWYGGSSFGTIYGFNSFEPWMSAPLSVKLISTSGQEITSYNIIQSRAGWSTGTMTQSFGSGFTEESEDDTHNGIGAAAWVAIIIGVSLFIACIIAGICYKRKNKSSKKEVAFNHNDGVNGDQVEIADNGNDTANTPQEEVGDDSDHDEEEIEIDVEVENTNTQI